MGGGAGRGGLLLDPARGRGMLGLDGGCGAADRLLLASAQETVEEYIGRSLSVREYLCVQKVRGGRVVPEELNPVAVRVVRDMGTGRELGCPFRIEGGAIALDGAGLEGRRLFIVYEAGYTGATLPAVLRECIIMLFLHKDGMMRRAAEGMPGAADVPEAVPAGVRELLEPYRRKSWW